MDDKNVFVNVRLMTDDILGTAAANRKLSRKVRGLGGWVFGLVVTCVILIAELAERKRCEKYLEEQIDDLKEKFDEGAGSDASDVIDIQQQIDYLEDRVNDLTYVVKTSRSTDDSKSFDARVPNGGARDV